jgi:predicted MFS family arabinose efflux permease
MSHVPISSWWLGLHSSGSHSLLIRLHIRTSSLAYAGSEKAAEDVGFYYAANAAGRLLGITLSGVLYQLGGITGCLIGSAVMLLLCCLITFLLPSTASSLAAKQQVCLSGERVDP